MLFNKLFKSCLKASQLPMAGLLLSMGFATSGSNAILAAELETPATAETQVAAAKLPTSDTAAAAANNQLQNGTYLYGESSKPEQLGKEYLVFEARNGKAVGAFYMPTSEFSCFYGTIKDRQMDLSVVEPYEQSTYTHSIALERKSLVASNNQVGLQGYESVSSVSDNDKQMLRVCRDKYEQQVWNQ